MTSSESKDQCHTVAQQLTILFKDKAWFKSCTVEKDDAGNHVDLRIKRSKLEGDAPHVGVIDGVRVCVVICG